jgi:hypothetical protein
VSLLPTKITPEVLATVAHLSSREAAIQLGVGKSTINDARRKFSATAPGKGPKILAFDLETSPNLAHVWGLFNQNVGLPQLRESTEVMCFGARWVGTDEVIFASTFHDGKQNMLKRLWQLVDEADLIMGWNSAGFDSKHIRRELLVNGFSPPRPWREFDLMQKVKKQFRFPSNKLDYVAQTLGVGKKVKHQGHELWVKCMAGDEEAWAEMRKYQIQDVDLLIDLLIALQGWLPSTPNFGLYKNLEFACAHCGSTKLTGRGEYYTELSVFASYECADCGGHTRDTKKVAGSHAKAI